MFRIRLGLTSCLGCPNISIGASVRTLNAEVERGRASRKLRVDPPNMTQPSSIEWRDSLAGTYPFWNI